MNLKINISYSGRQFRKIRSDATVLDLSTTTPYDLQYVIYPDGKVIQLTGVYFVYNGIAYYQLTNNANYFADLRGWNSYSVNSKKYTVAEAQNLINGIIRNNQYILNNNLLCARFAYKLSTSDRKLLYLLQRRLEQRNTALKNDQLLTTHRVGYPQGYSMLSGNLEAFMNNRQAKVGAVLSSTAIIIISAVVVTAFSTAAYFAYQAFYKESAQDVKFSRALTEKLRQTLTAEEYRQLLEETQGIVTKSKIRQQLASLGGNIKMLLLVGLGMIVALRAPKWIEAAQKAPTKK